MAFDFLTTSYSLDNDNPLLYEGLTGTLLAEATAIVADGPDVYHFPYDTYDPANIVFTDGSVKLRQQAHDYALDMADGTLNGTVGGIPVGSLRMYGADITSITMDSTTLRDDGGNSFARVIVYFTVPSDTNGLVLSTWGGHLGIGTDTFVNGLPEGWGEMNGAMGISGSPFHMVFKGVYWQFDPDGTGKGSKIDIGDLVQSMSGDQDRSMSADAVFVYADVSGYKWNDANANGVWDTDEVGLADWTIHVDGGPYGTVHLAAVTGPGGYYAFTHVPMGTYTLSEDLKAGWSQTYPVAGTYSISVTGSGQVFSNKNFGNCLLHPAISVTKGGPAQAHEDQTITYTIVVSNTGDCPLYNVWVEDTLLGNLTVLLPDRTLDVGESNTIHPTYTIPVPQIANVVNTVTVHGYDILGRPVTDDADHSVDVIHPGILVTKVGTRYAHVGDPVSWTITVTNTGDCILYNVTVDDDLLGLHETIAVLGIGDDETYTVPGVASADLTNTVDVWGEDIIHGEASDSASWTLDVMTPQITIVKVGPTKVHPFDTITYQIYVNNTGDCILYNVTVYDPLTGDTIPIGTMNVGAHHAPITVLTVAGSVDVLNVASVDGDDILGGPNGYVFAEDSWPTEVLIPDILLVKTVTPTMIHSGETVKYTYTITNTGNCPLYSITVEDSELDLSSYLPDTSVIPLASGAWISFDVETSIYADVTNTATAYGTDALGKQVSAGDYASVDVIFPEIAVTKTGPHYAHIGDTITYTITVENTGDCMLHDVWVVDTLLGNITSYLEDRTLDVGEVNTIEVTFVVNIERGDLPNTVTAKGIDPIYRTVSSSASHTVEVILQSVVTDTQFCVFDMDPSQPGQQFRLIFTPSNNGNGGMYKLASTNPGQFYYNVFYLGTPGEPYTVHIQIPYPFITNGAMPIHVYNDFDITTNGCTKYWQIGAVTDFMTGGNTSTITSAGQHGISLSDYGAAPKIGSWVELTVTGTVPDTGLVYVTVHLEFGLKHTASYGASDKTATPDAYYLGDDGDYDVGDLVLHYGEGYLFAWWCGDEWVEPTIYSENVFKKDPGFAGLVTGSSGDPLSGMTVTITISAKDHITATVFTDEDGWYLYAYKYTGKSSIVNIHLWGYKENWAFVDVLMKTNSLIIVDFAVPGL